MPNRPDKVLHLLILATPYFNLGATTGFIDPFRAANYLQGRALYDWTLASEAGGPCPASNGIEVATQPLAELSDRRFDIVILSSSWTPERNSSPRLHAQLWQWALSGSTLGALDTGAFILAQAGLLKDRRATVHYEHIDALGEMYPTVNVSDALFVFDGNRITCAGGAASTDFALHILSGTHGDAVANGAARYLFHQSMRPPGSTQNAGASEPLGSVTPVTLRRAISAMEAHLETPLSIAEIAAEAKVSHRQLNRLFDTYVGKTPSLYYRDIRLDRARGLVTQTDMALSQVALASGFSSPVHFSRAYKERFGLPPRQDRVEGRVPFEFRAWPMHRSTGDT